jgi:hypothetical protein
MDHKWKMEIPFDLDNQERCEPISQAYQQEIAISYQTRRSIWSSWVLGVQRPSMLLTSCVPFALRTLSSWWQITDFSFVFQVFIMCSYDLHVVYTLWKTSFQKMRFNQALVGEFSFKLFVSNKSCRNYFPARSWRYSKFQLNRDAALGVQGVSKNPIVHFIIQFPL